MENKQYNDNFGDVPDETKLYQVFYFWISRDYLLIR